MSLPRSLWVLILMVSSNAYLAAADSFPPLNDSQCNCFMTNGSEKAFFSHHLFFDFRNLAEYAHVPPVITSANGSASAAMTSEYFMTDDWARTWGIQSWNNSARLRTTGVDASLLLINSPNNVYIQKNDDLIPSSSTYLTMRTKRLPGFQTAAEFESTSSAYKFLSVRMYARTIGPAGACTAMFTYRQSDDISQVQEADLEVLTKDSRKNIQYTNQPSFTADGSGVDGASQNVTLPGSLEWSDWAVHRLDWDPKQSTWYANGQKVANISFQVPRDESMVIFNSWSDGGSWSGNMSLYDEAYMQIQWIEMVYNSTQPTVKRDVSQLGSHGGPYGQHVRRSGNDNCKVICSIDETGVTGQAVMIHNSTAPGRLFTTGEGFGHVMLWIPIVVISVMVISSASLII